MAYTTINKAASHFKAFKYTGTGSAGTVTGVGFDPDFMWHKNRDNNQGHGVIDRIRGNNNYISPNTANGQLADVGSYGLATDGFTFPNGDAFFNGSGNGHIAWTLKADGTSGSSNSDGSTTSTVAVNTTSGFSMVKWTGSGSNITVGHGLGVTPGMILIKNYGGSGTNWIVWHKELASSYFLKLNLAGAQTNANSYFTAEPTSSILSLSGGTAANNSGNGMIAYCFAEKNGYCKTGQYEGNGSTDGTFVYTGFRPQFVITKRYNGIGNWLIFDEARSGYNVDNDEMPWNNTAAAENDGQTYQYIDLVSNGFKFREASDNKNGSNDTYVYMAIGQSLVGTNNIPCTAR